MSLDISLEGKGGRFHSMNWLRNPFGLCQWAEDNIELPAEVEASLLERAKKHDEQGDYPKKAEKGSLLWFVCNRWCYERGGDIDRRLFLDVVKAYASGVEKLERGYYFFTFGAYRQFIEPYREKLPSDLTLFAYGGTKKIEGEIWRRASPEFMESRLGIPMEHLKDDGSFHLRDHCTLDYYKEWIRELADFAERLQDEDVNFHGSN